MRPPNSKSRPRAFTREERSQWVSRFRSSGLPQAQFAQRHGLKLTTLQKWLYGRSSRRVGKQQRRAGPKEAKRSRARFREIMGSPLWSGPASAGWIAEVTWPSSVTVRLGAEAEAPWIESLLGAVRQAC